MKHILLDCPELRDVRLKYLTASSLKDIFESVDNQIIIDFVKDAHFYSASALLAMQSAVLARGIPSVRPSVCLSFRHVPVLCPDE